MLSRMMTESMLSNVATRRELRVGELEQDEISRAARMSTAGELTEEFNNSLRFQSAMATQCSAISPSKTSTGFRQG